MTDFCFLAHIIDPFGIEDPALVVGWPDGKSSAIDLADLSGITHTIVSYGVPSLVAALRTDKSPLPRRLVEIKDGLKLSSGIAKDQGGERKWDAFRGLASVEPGKYARDVAEITQGRRLQPSRDEVIELLTKTSNALFALWEDLRITLGSSGEWERFLQIEIPVQQIFWFRQYHGVALDIREWGDVCERTQKEKYDAYRALASMIGVSPSTIKYQNIGKYLPGTDAEFLLDFARSPSLEGYFEVASEVSEFAREYVAFSQARKDESVLLRINPLAERMYPIFECFGTVTGRIIVLNPALQALRRRHRQIIKSDEGKKLLYLDYAQFEPGILAYVSGDRAFIDAYNTHDLYVELSRTLFGSSSKRSEAKRIFLAYSYGMSTSSIARLLRGNRASAAEIEVEKNKIASFFSNYPGLSRLRESLLDELQNTGSISSLMGNHRRRVIKGRLTTKEQNWALSQKIQGTASLIFKDALIALSNTYGADSILLPMHDAVLLQVPENEDLKKELAAIMAASFDKWCPGISVRITSENFASKAH